MSHVAIIQDIYTALSTNAGVMGKVTGIFDVPPEDQPSPYIVIDTLQSLEGRLLNATERQWAVDVHIWSSYKGKKEVLEIADLVVKALDDSWFFEELMVMRDPSGWFHGVLTIRGYERR